MSNITVNKVELAAEIASRVMDEKYLHGQGEEWMEENPASPDIFRIKPDLEDEYNQLYDEAEALIIACESKED